MGTQIKSHGVERVALIQTCLCCCMYGAGKDFGDDVFDERDVQPHS